MLIGEWKKGIVLKRNCGKPDVIAEIQRRGFHPKDDNEADALGVLLYSSSASAS